MNRMTFRINAILLLPLLLLASGQAAAASQNYEFHADARMRHATGNDVDNAYGYVHVVTDKKGHGVIRVMFSNGTSLHEARFNARIRFLDADGKLIRTEKFDYRVEAAGLQGAAERRLTKLVDLTEFADIEVDFFVSDIPAAAVVASNLGTRYSGF